MFTSLPRKLQQSFDVDGLRVVMQLRYASNRTALVQAFVDNTSGHARSVGAGWTGSLLRPAAEPMKSAPSVHATSTGVSVGFAGMMGDGPLMENYNPATGSAMNSRGFSWSAALLLELAHQR